MFTDLKWQFQHLLLSETDVWFIVLAGLAGICKFNSTVYLTVDPFTHYFHAEFNIGEH